MPSLEEIKLKLNARKAFYAEEYGVARIGIFGSYSREDQSESSDIDVLVEFDRPIGLEFVDLADDLERLLNAKVDLVSKKSIKPRMLRCIEPDLVYV